jgi:hypothetical protein
MTNQNRLPASELVGGIEIMRELDIRRRGKPFNDMVECDPMHCACCGREIFKIAELRNGDVIGSECACIIPNSPAMRMGRFLNKRQQEYARRYGLLA